MEAQENDPALKTELMKLGAAADELDKALPSFTCKETGASEVRQPHKKVKSISFVATLRARRTNESGAHNETFTLTELKGEPYSGAYTFPFYVSGGFDKGMRYFAPRLQGCYEYALLPGKIEFATRPDAGEHPPCRDEKVQGFALLDKDGNVTHLERRVPMDVSDAYRLAPFTAIDFGPVELNGETFRLAQHMVAEHGYEHTTTRFEVAYSECKLFQVTVTIGPATSVPGEPKVPE